MHATVNAAIITSAATPDSHPDCRALLTQIVALQKDDVRSRPLYANYLGAQGLISLHTNSPPETPGQPIDTSVRGTQVYYHNSNRPEDLKLVESVSCYMEEYFNWFPGTKGRQAVPIPANLGEVRLAAMPAVIVEVGFHTNAEDRALIVDPNFQNQAMRSVEKGWRMYREGKPCAPFAIPGVLPGVTGTHNTAIPMPLPYAGYPRFPVRAEFRVYTSCTAFDCSKIQIVNFPNPLPSPLPATFTCETASSTPTVTVDFEVQLFDADGVKTDIRKHYAKCVKP